MVLNQVLRVVLLLTVCVELGSVFLTGCLVICAIKLLVAWVIEAPSVEEYQQRETVVLTGALFVLMTLLSLAFLYTFITGATAY